MRARSFKIFGTKTDLENIFKLTIPLNIINVAKVLIQK